MLFEDNFRGDPEEIKKKQSSYVSFFKDHSNILDIGCGRGEFLQLLKENNITGYGVDSSQEMINDCASKGLIAKKEDAIEHLKNTEADSLGGIFSSQVVEHLKPAKVVRLIELSHQKLKPGSHLVIETLNPQCLNVLHNYTIDLSHEKLIHPQTLFWLSKMIGFSDVKIEYYDEFSEDEKLKPIQTSKTKDATLDNETASILNSNIEKLNNLLFGYQNFALIAKK